MKFNFDDSVDRTNTDCLKYDFAEENGKSCDMLPMWIADMDICTPPAVRDALVERVHHGIFGYTMPKKHYFETVAKWFKTRHNWDADPNNFICTPGVVFAINTLLRATTKEGDTVIICQPVYYPFANSVRYNGRKLVVSELINNDGNYSIDFADFEKKITDNCVKAFILCSPHNPVGRVWTREELETIGNICLKHGVFVISDEIHADFTYPGYTHVVFPSVDKRFEEICAVCTSPSKSFNIAGLQNSNIYIPNRKVRKDFEDELDKIGYWEPNIMGAVACEAAYTKGADWLDELKLYIAQNLAFARCYIMNNLPGIKLVEPQGTYLLWLDCRGLNLSDEQLETLFEEKAKLWPDEGYIFGAGGSGFERLNMACPRKTLKRALESIKNALDLINTDK